MTTNPQQVAALLKDVIARGVDTKDAVPTVKILVQAKIFSLNQLSHANLPEGLKEFSEKKNDPRWIQRLLRQPARRRSTAASQQAKTKQKKNMVVTVVHPPPVSSTPATILINRAPLLTLWATVVAEHVLELEFHEALTFGSAVAAMTAKAKGQSLGIYQKEGDANVAAVDESDTKNKKNIDDIETISFFGYAIRARRVPKDPKFTSTSSSSSVLVSNWNKTNSWLLALDVSKNDIVLQPSSILTYLQKKFPSSSLGFVYSQMQRAVQQAGRGAGGRELQTEQQQETDEKNASWWKYYMAVRPNNIGVGAAGWGNHGTVSTAALAEWYTHVGGGSSSSSSSSSGSGQNDGKAKMPTSTYS